MANDSGCLKAAGITAAVLAGTGLLAVIGVVGLGILASNTNPPRPKATTTTEPAAVTNRRLFLEEHRWDDRTRAELFRATLRGSGQRCDRVDSALMTDSGVWSVRCSPGHVFVFTFGADGGLISANRLR